jgi:hypothetical protein
MMEGRAQRPPPAKVRAQEPEPPQDDPALVPPERTPFATAP